MENKMYKQAVEYLNDCFIETWCNYYTKKIFYYTVIFPDGVSLDFKTKQSARNAAKKKYES